MSIAVASARGLCMRPPWLHWALWPVLLVALVLPMSAQAAGRVALVVGNAAYADRPLRNPVNDAQLMQASLKQLGFDVKLVQDANRRGMLDALRDFEARARGAEVALFYFAGHGAQVGGTNYLLPLGARIRNAAEVADEALEATSVLRRIEASRPKVGLVILDACRDNPFPGAERSASKGLARMDAPTGTIVAYSTAPGSVADDGKGTHGVYTAALARYLVEPGLDIKEIFDRTAQDVERTTNGRQRPREDIGLRGRFVMRPVVNAVAAVKPEPASSSPPPAPPAVAVAPAQVTAAVPSLPPAPTVGGAGAAPRVFRDCAECPEMVSLPEGRMPTAAGSSVGAQGAAGVNLPVAVPAFAIGRYEVTVAEFMRFVRETEPQQAVPDGDDASGCFSALDGRWSAQRTWLAPGFPQIPTQPAVCVTWAQAQRYADWLSRKTGKRYRLPTGGQWEYAARARSPSDWPWGNRAEAVCEHANVADQQGVAKLRDWQLAGHDCDDRHAYTAPVGSFRPSAFGLNDMIGNVAEFSSDCEEAASEPAGAAGGASKAIRLDDTTSTTCQRHMVRGGAWVLSGQATTVNHRFGVTPGFRSDFVGFRVVRDLP